MLFSPVFAANHLRPVSTKTAGCVANNSHSGTHLTVAALFTTLKFFLFTLLHTLLHAQKLIRFPFMYLRTLCTKHPGLGGYPSHQKAGKSLASAILSSPEDPLEVAKSILLILTALFPIVNPLGGSPVFFALTREYPHPVRRILARHVALNSFILLIASFVIGTHILHFF